MPENLKAPSIPDYEILLLVGSGSYGEVWLARGITGLYRAVKVVRRERFSDDEPYEREFNGLREFAAISLAAPNQLALLHIGRNDAAKFFYYVMELADDLHGGIRVEPASYIPRTLQVIRRVEGRMPILQVVALGADLARALAGLHSRGLVHCDVKPSNVIFVGGAPKLADIGLVSAASSTRMFVGTEGFVAPEGPGNPPADVYSLGKLLYEAAIGLDRREFPRLPANFSELSNRRQFLELNEIIVRACDPQPERRYPDARAILVDLERMQAGRPIRTAVSRYRRGFRIAAMLAASAVVVGAFSPDRAIDPSIAAPPDVQRDFVDIVQERGAAVERIRFLPGNRHLVYMSADRRLTAWDRAETRPVQVWKNIAALSKLSFDGNWMCITETAGNGRWISVRGEFTRPVKLVGDLSRQLRDEREAGFAWVAEDAPAPAVRMRGALATPEVFIPLTGSGAEGGDTIRHAASATRAAFAAIVVGSAGGEKAVWKLNSVDLNRRKVMRVDDLETAPAAVAISPDGRFVVIAYAASSDVEMRGFSSTGSYWRRSFGSGRPEALAFSPDGETVAVAGRDSAIYLVKAADGTLRRILRGQTGAIVDLDWSSDGLALVAGSTTGDIRIWHSPLRNSPPKIARGI